MAVGSMTAAMNSLRSLCFHILATSFSGVFLGPEGPISPQLSYIIRKVFGGAKVSTPIKQPEF